MSPSPAILVHISAPSRASDDARYRRELQSFLDFEPVKLHVLSSEQPTPKLQFDEYGHALEQVADASFTSSSNPTSLPPESKPQRAKSKLVTPASAVFNPLSKSSVLVPGTTSHKPINKTRTIVSPQCRPRTAPNGSNDLSGIQETPFLHRAHSDSWKTPPSVIPDSQPTPYSQKRQQLHFSSPSPTRSSSPTTRRKRQRLGSPLALPRYEIADEDDEEELTSSAAQPAPPASSSYGADAEASSTPIPVLSSPRFRPKSPHIHPPRAPISVARFKTHKTPFLSMLSDSGRLPLETYYIPQIVSQTRKIAILERGHWRVDISNFSEALKGRFWGDLKRFVGEGRVGWGVWCALESDGEAGADTVGEQDHILVKIFCWGEIVGEIWNVLFMASNRRIKGTSACWVDAEDKIVVKMK